MPKFAMRRRPRLAQRPPRPEPEVVRLSPTEINDARRLLATKLHTQAESLGANVDANTWAPLASPIAYSITEVQGTAIESARARVTVRPSTELVTFLQSWGATPRWDHYYGRQVWRVDYRRVEHYHARRVLAIDTPDVDLINWRNGSRLERAHSYNIDPTTQRILSDQNQFLLEYVMLFGGPNTLLSSDHFMRATKQTEEVNAYATCMSVRTFFEGYGSPKCACSIPVLKGSYYYSQNSLTGHTQYATRKDSPNLPFGDLSEFAHNATFGTTVMVPVYPLDAMGMADENADPVGIDFVFYTLASAGLPEMDIASLDLAPGIRGARVRSMWTPVATIDLLTALLRARGVDLLDESGRITEFERAARNNVVITPVRGKPACAEITVGRDAGRLLYGLGKVSDAIPNGLPPEIADGLWSERRRTSARRMAQELDIYDKLVENDGVLISPEFTEAMEMAKAIADPLEDDALWEYQREIVSMHQVAYHGYLNSLETGMGKTVTTLRAFAERAHNKPADSGPWRGIVVCEAVVRKQWEGEAKTWLPRDIRIVTITTRKQIDALRDALASDEHYLILVSYQLAADIADVINETPDEDSKDPTPMGEVLALATFDDMAIDEALCIKSGSSKGGKALWHLRDNTTLCTILTATPITTSMNNISKLISFIKNDPEMFYGVDLTVEYDMTLEDDRKEFHEAFWPLIYRQTKQLANLHPKLVQLNPTKAEADLSVAIQKELRKILDEMISTLDLLSRHNDSLSDEEIAQTKESLEQIRGALVGSTTLARLAASDPEAIAHSESISAEILRTQGYIERAIANGGTKLNYAIELCKDYASRKESVVIFTEFSQTANKLAERLVASGLSVGKVVGGGGAKRDEDIVAFQNGELDVIVCTKAGERGLNLHHAKALIHFDTGWTPDTLIQRNGRVNRIGATHDDLDIHYLVLKSTVDERILAVAVTRAAESTLALDASRGAGMLTGESGQLLAGLIDQIDRSWTTDAKSAGLLEVASVLAAEA